MQGSLYDTNLNNDYYTETSPKSPCILAPRLILADGSYLVIPPLSNLAG